MATVEMLDPAATTTLQPSDDSDTFGSGSANMTDDSTPSSTPPPLTHDTSRARFHMKDLGCFATCLENSAKRAFPTRGRACSRYKSVQALLLMWEDDELGVDNELDGLHQVFRSYGFDTETWLIPSENPHLKLTIKAANFVEKYESEDSLLIVYYGGHAAINSARQSSWYWKEDPEFASISLEWSAIQTVFEKAISDVLLLLDCCFAASAAPIAGRAITETIAACGWEAIAPAPGRWSFTSALIEVLEEWINHSFSVAMLHSKVLSVLKHEQPERRGQKKRKVECRRTPVYIHTSAEPGTPSINLSRLRSKVSSEGQTKVGVQVGSNGQASFEAKKLWNNPETYSLDDLTSPESTGDFKVPHVLISLALCEDQELELKACSEWLAAFPALAKYATVKGVYRSHSTLVIASVPVVIWNLLPENRACSFIGYITSDNLLDLRETSYAPTITAYSQVVDSDGNSRAENHSWTMDPLNESSSTILANTSVDSASVVKMEPSGVRVMDPRNSSVGYGHYHMRLGRNSPTIEGLGTSLSGTLGVSRSKAKPFGFIRNLTIRRNQEPKSVTGGNSQESISFLPSDADRAARDELFKIILSHDISPSPLAEEAERLLAPCVAWYAKFLECRFRGAWTTSIREALRHVGNFTNEPLPDEIGVVYGFMSIVAKSLLESRHLSMIDIVDEAYNLRLLKDQIDGRREIPNQLVFAAVGWLTMLYDPQPIQPPGELVIRKPEGFLPRSRRRLRFSSTINSYREQGFEAFDQPLYLFLRKFGRLIPEPLVGLEGVHELITVSYVCFAMLDKIADVKIEWVNSLCLHLEFDNVRRILKIFRFPSFCMLMYRDVTFISKLYLESSRIFRIQDAEGQAEDLTPDYFREVLLSYRLIFGQDPKSWKAFQKTLSTYKEHWDCSDNQSDDGDPMLRILCCSSYKSPNASRIYQDIDASEVASPCYYPDSDFPFLGRRILNLQAFVRGRNLQN